MGPLSLKQRHCVLLCFILQAFLWSLLVKPTAQLSRKPVRGAVSHQMRITKMQCIHTPYKYTKLHYCYMVQMPNGKVGLNASITISIPINYLGISVKVFYKYTTYRPFMIDWSMEYCQAARKANYNPSTAIIMKVLEETLPDLYYPCPHGVSKIYV
uniref:Uncharacterized protein n=1 Tax=Anopheles epiroticus TaxID=199890 RepID=A0A9I3FHB8_9DIPT